MASKQISLGEIPSIASNITTMPVKSASILHKLIFENDAKRKNRSNLRKFSGFAFEIDSNEYEQKLQYIKENYTERELIGVCTHLGIEVEETEDDLIKKILSMLMNLEQLILPVEDDDEGDENNDENSEVSSEHTGVSESKDNNQVAKRSGVESDKKLKYNCAISYKDVEESIRRFDGKSNYTVEMWIEDFEETAEMLEWNDLQKFIFGKKALDGNALLHVRSERNIKNWERLKKVLLDEFSKKISMADLHKELSNRKMKNDEDVYQYFLIMKDIASKGLVDEKSLIQYVIEGIKDITVNKMMLFGAKDLKEFKEKLHHYSDYRDECKMNKVKLLTTGNKVQTEQKEKERCYNCGVRGHKSVNCNSKNFGMKCFNCNKFGHKADKCKEPKINKTIKSTPVNNVLAVKMTNMCKEIQIEAVKLIALIDTGSAVSIIREDKVALITHKGIQNSKLILSAFGGQEVQSKGSVKVNIEIDDDQYEIQMEIVPAEMTQYDIILGNTFLKEIETTITKDGIKIKRPQSELQIMNINVVENNSEVDLSHIEDKCHKNEVENLIKNYKPRQEKFIDMEMKIVLNDETPIFHSPRRLPFVERDIVDKQVDEWLGNDIIEPCISEFASQVVLVRKKDGTPRICVDYRKLNKVVMKDRYPMPILEEQIDSLRDYKVFSTIDLCNGFFHVRVESNGKKYTAFVAHKGQFQFKRVPFGFCNSPANFQPYINCVFRDLKNKNIVLIYLDDVIILAKDEEEAMSKLKLVFQTAEEYGLDINFKKSQFLRRRIQFLGHVIENNQVYPSSEKVAAVINYPEPKSIKDIQSFLGLTGYFRKFIRNYSLIARPLSDMIKKDKVFQFLEEEKQCFNLLKKKLTEKPVLHIFKRNAETEVHTDASMFGFGGILLQKDDDGEQFHPVFYYSKKTSDAERKYSSYELEVLAVVKSLQKFRVYLIGQHFQLLTDCVALKQTMSKPDLLPRVARWALSLSEYDFTIQHRSGERMRHADALSRYPVMSISEDSIIAKVKYAQVSDDYLKTIFEVLKKQPYDDFFVKDDVLYKFRNGIDLLVVPDSMQEEVIKKAHSKGHFGVVRTIEHLNQQFYIPKIREKAEKVIRNCLECILINRKAGKKEGFLHPRSKGEEPLYTYHMDHIGPLDSTNKNYKHLLVIIDDFTKFVWIYPTKSTTTREVISRLEIQKKTFGNPNQIVTDKGTAFTSEEFKQYCTEENIEHHTVTTGLPRANGQVERINATIISVLSKASADQPTKWYKYVDTIQRMLNSTFHRSINSTPFEVLIGTKMRNKDDLKVKQLIEEEMQQLFSHNRELIRKQARECIQKIQEENSKQYNKNRTKAKVYKVNDLVAIKRIQMGPGMKLRPKYLGPYRITKVKGNSTYDVEKIGKHEGPSQTSTCAEYIKPWEYSSLGTNVKQDDRVWERKKMGNNANEKSSESQS